MHISPDDLEKLLQGEGGQKRDAEADLEVNVKKVKKVAAKDQADTTIQAEQAAATEAVPDEIIIDDLPASTYITATADEPQDTVIPAVVTNVTVPPAVSEIDFSTIQIVSVVNPGDRRKKYSDGSIVTNAGLQGTESLK